MLVLLRQVQLLAIEITESQGRIAAEWSSDSLSGICGWICEVPQAMWRARLARVRPMRHATDRPGPVQLPVWQHLMTLMLLHLTI